jgi:hypothetical protein
MITTIMIIKINKMKNPPIPPPIPAPKFEGGEALDGVSSNWKALSNVVTASVVDAIPLVPPICVLNIAVVARMRVVGFGILGSCVDGICEVGIRVLGISIVVV